MELSVITLNRIEELRVAKTEAKSANKTETTKRDLLIEGIIIDGLGLYVENKEAFTSYNNFIKAYEAELLSNIDGNEISLQNVVNMVTFALKKGLGAIVKHGTISKIFKYQKTINFTALKNASDKKSVNAVINEAVKAYETELRDTKVYKALMEKSGLELDAIKEIIAVIKSDRKKEEKKREAKKGTPKK